MNNINEDGIIRIIMLYLDFETCCKNSSMLNFALTNKKYTNLMLKLNRHNKIKYYKLSYKFRHKLNFKCDNICVKCNNLSNYKIETLVLLDPVDTFLFNQTIELYNIKTLLFIIAGKTYKYSPENPSIPFIPF